VIIHLKPAFYYQILGLIQEDQPIEAMRILREATSSSPVTFPLSTIQRIVETIQDMPGTPPRAYHSTIIDCVQDINLDQDIELYICPF